MGVGVRTRPVASAAWRQAWTAGRLSCISGDERVGRRFQGLGCRHGDRNHDSVPGEHGEVKVRRCPSMAATPAPQRNPQRPGNGSIARESGEWRTLEGVPERLEVEAPPLQPARTAGPGVRAAPPGSATDPIDPSSLNIGCQGVVRSGFQLAKTSVFLPCRCGQRSVACDRGCGAGATGRHSAAEPAWRMNRLEQVDASRPHT